MTVTPTRVSRKLEATARAFQQLADHTIKKDPVRALVELITNSDDSYKKLERLGIEQKGQIIIRFMRVRGAAQLRVTDFAQGMSSELMDKAVGMYGAETHGFNAGQGGRSFFGRGLKEAILGMGYGFVKSIENNLYHDSMLSVEKYEREIPKEANQIYKDELSIQLRGTQITLVIDRPSIKIPHFESLKRSLEFHYALRDILSSQKREIILRECGKNEQVEKEVKLSYVTPKGTAVINKKGSLIEFENAEIELVIAKSEEDLTGREDGYLRQNGVLIASSGAIHDINLFKFEGDELATNLFGRVTCDHIDTLLRMDEPVIADSRDGMDWSHPLNKAVRKFVEDELELYISEERKKSQTQEKNIESESTKKRFKKAIEKINSIANTELSNIDYSEGQGNQPGTMLPPNGFDFIPNYYHVLVGKKSTLTLKISSDLLEENKLPIKISTDSPYLEALNDEIRIDGEDLDQSVISVHTYVEGKQIGEEAKVMAIMGNLKAEARVHIIAQEKKDKRKRRKKKHRGIFRDIKYSSTADPNQRVRYDRNTGLIVIATTAPSVKLYLGPNGEGQDQSESRVMTAELVTQAVCRELAKLRVQSGEEPILGEPEEALNAVYTKLISKYSHMLHLILGPK